MTNAQRVDSALDVGPILRACTARKESEIQRIHSVLLSRETNGPRMQYNTNNTTSFISNIEHNYIITTVFTQHWDGWKGGGQKKNHCQYKIKQNNEKNKVQIVLMH